MTDEEWQPIETAPLDGTSILLFAPDYRTRHVVVVGFWGDDPVESSKEMDRRRTWRVKWDHGCMFDCDYEPSHWMPLPNPPTQSHR